MSAQLQTLLAGMAVLTLSILLLAGFVLTVRRLLTPQGEVIVLINDQLRISAPVGAHLVRVLADHGVHLPAACGGRGACGQCRLRITQGAPPLTAVEASHISAPAARVGERLACVLTLRADLAIQLPEEFLEAQRWVCTVASARHITTLMKEIVLELPHGHAVDFQAGSYVLIEAPPHRVRFEDFEMAPEHRKEWQRHGLLRLESASPVAVQRAYSLANPPSERKRLMLTVRLALPPHDRPEGTPPGLASSWLFSLRAGDEVAASGPFGDFRARETDHEMVLIGGGAGIAPLRSIIHDQLERQGRHRRISFWYGARNLRELCYRAEFDELARRHDHFHWQAALSEPETEDDWSGPVGFIHAVVFECYLRDHPAPEDIEFYVCGPPLMNLAVVQMLEDLGVDHASIFLDDFGAAT